MEKTKRLKEVIKKLKRCFEINYLKAAINRIYAVLLIELERHPLASYPHGMLVGGGGR